MLPGRILKQELDARDWTQRDLAAILGRPEQAISEIVNGTKQITPETSLELSQAFGTSPEFWHAIWRPTIAWNWRYVRRTEM